MATLVYDSHCHLAALTANNSSYPVAVPAIRLTDIQELANYRRQNPLAKIGLGIHPWYLPDAYDLSLIKQELRHLIQHYQPDFIGETGLDALKANFDQQELFFNLHLELAEEFNLAIIIHCVKAYNQLLQLLTQYARLRGIVHAFNANQHIAERLKHKNMLLGIGSIIMQPTSTLAKASSLIPLEQIVIESDAPYMRAPGKLISSSTDCLSYAQVLANYQQKSCAEVINTANLNWQKIFAKI